MSGIDFFFFLGHYSDTIAGADPGLVVGGGAGSAP